MPALSDSGGISDDGQGSANVSNDGDGGDASDEDDDKYILDCLGQNYDFCKIPFHASSGRMPPQNGQKPVSSNDFFSAIFSAP
jgi:hypothetical protein